jgi:hypothetical protein
VVRTSRSGRPSVSGEGEGSDETLVFSRQVQGHAARGQDPEAGGRVQQSVHRRSRVDDLLEVVQHQEEITVPEVGGQRVEDIRARLLPHAQGRGDVRGNQGRVRHRAQVDHVHAVLDPVHLLGGDPQRQARLASAARPGEGEEPGAAEQLADLGDLALASDERRSRWREVRPTWPSEGADRWELSRETVDDEVVERLGLVEVLQPVAAEVADRHSLGEGVLDEHPCGLGDQDLAPVCGGGDPGRSVHIDPDVVAAADGTLTGVQPHPNPERRAVRPVFLGQASLRGHRGADPLPWGAEHREEGVALGSNLVAVLRLQGVPEDLRVAILDGPIPLAELLEQPGGALDVCEQERHRPRRQIGHASPFLSR